MNRLNAPMLENLGEQPVLSASPILKDRRNAGIALVTVLAVTMLVLGLLTLITGLTTRSARLTRTDAATTALVQLADGYSDVARVVLTENLRLSKLPAGAWLDLISADRKNDGAINPVDPKVVKLAGNHLLETDGASLGWEIKSVSAPSERAPWVRVAATAEDSAGRSQTVLRKVQFDGNKIFDLAMLADDVNCMFCHLKVEGDVGSIHAFRPGAGLESDGGTCQIPGSSCGIGSGGRSVIDGDVFVASSFTKDDSSNNKANGAEIRGRKYERYSGERLPQNDKTGATEFPGLDREVARTGANGKLSGGSLSGVTAGQGWAARSSLTGVNGFYDGNLVLIGTKENPIKLDGDIYASGDVVIKGVVTGRGAVYAGRNAYIAGDLTNQNRADKPGLGECKGISSLDECALKNISAGKDELRISAGNNIVLGNFTEKDAKSNPLSRRDVQAAAYFREQFGLAYQHPLFETQDRFVRKGSGEELRKDGAGYIDQLGRKVASTEVQIISGDAVYANLLAPGMTDKDGSFSRWLSDGEYQEILGKEEIKHGLWRTRFRFDDPNDPKNGGVTPERYKDSPDAVVKAQRVADLVKELEASGFPKDAPKGAKFLEELAKKIIENPKSLQDQEWIQDFSGKTVGDPPVGGQQVSGRVSFDGSYLRVAMIEGYKYAREVTQLDAFLYANNRIAGKLGARGGFINGGLIARELGVLAPGRNNYNPEWLGTLSEENQKAFRFCDRIARPTDSVDDAENSTINVKDTYVTGKNTTENTCNYAVRYDHRLRNGGYGFNLYQGTTGITANWEFDSDGCSNVFRPKSPSCP